MIDVILSLDKQLLTEVGKKELAKISAQSQPEGAQRLDANDIDGGEIPFRAGCTAVVALVLHKKIFVANLGDSRCVLIDKKGLALPLSTDHKPQNELERHRIEAAGASVSEDRVNGNLAVSRALGDCEYKDRSLQPEEQAVTALPEVTEYARDGQEDFLVLACDGIWDCMTN